MLLDTLFWAAIVFSVIWVLIMAHRLGIWPQGSYDDQLGRFFDRARRRGLTMAEARDELTMREALVRVRNRASMWAIREPDNASRAITVSLQNAKERLPKHLHRRWDAWAATLTHAEILTDQAMSVVKAHEKKMAKANAWMAGIIRGKPTDEQRASLRVR